MEGLDHVLDKEGQIHFRSVIIYQLSNAYQNNELGSVLCCKDKHMS